MAGVNPQMVVRIAANIEQLKKALAEGTSAVTTTTAGFSKLAGSLDGSRLIQQGHNITAVVNSLGDATKFTDAEAKRLRDTLDKVIDKANRMGTEIPADILKTRDALVRTNAEAEKLPQKLTAASKAGSFLASTFSQFTAASLASTAILGAVSALGDFISQGQKLPALQASFNRLTAGLRQDGDTMLKNMTASTRGMVSNYDLMQTANKAMLLGLPVTSQSMGELSKAATTLGRAMGMDATKSLDDLITALGRSSPMILDNLGLTVKVGEANEAYAAKLGKTAEQLTDGEKKLAFYEAAMEAARRKTAELGDQTRSLGEIAQSVWVQIGNVVSSTAGIINTQVGKILSSKDALITFVKLMAASADPGKALAMMQAFDEAKARAMNQRGDIHLPSGKGAANTDYVKQLEAARAAVAGLSKEQRAGIAAAQALGVETKDITARFGVSDTVLKVLGTTTKEASKASSAASKASKEYADLMKEIAAAQVPLTARQTLEIDRLSAIGIGYGKIAQALRVSDVAVKGYIDANKTLDDMLKKVASSTREGLDGFSKVPGALVPMKNAISEINLLLPPLALGMDKIVGAEGLGKFISQWDLPLPKIEEVSNGIGELSSALANLAQVSGGAFGGMVSDLARVVAAIDSAQKGMAAFSAGKKAGGLEGILGMTSGILGMASAALAAGQALKGMWDAAFGNKGRDLVKDFATSLGGFDALRAKLVPLGAEGEKLWISLTQGVGRNNPKQAQAAVDAVTAALKKQEDAQADAARAAESAAGKVQKAAKETTNVVVAQLSELQKQRDSLVQSIANEAPEEVMGIIEAETRARIAQVEAEMRAKQTQLDAAAEAGQAAIDQVKDDAVEVNDYVRELFGKPMRIPIEWDYAGMQGGFFGGSGMPSQSSSSASSQTITVPLYIDGQQVSESVVRTSKRLGLA